MKPIRRNPMFDDLIDVQKDISRFFRRAVGFGAETLDTFARPDGGWIPAVDVYAKNGNLIVKAQLPSVDPNNIDVSVKNNVLTISGERKAEQEVSEENVYTMESSYGQFERSVTLPQEVKLEKIKASYSNGVLEIEIPGAAKKEPKEQKIPVEFKQ